MRIRQFKLSKSFNRQGKKKKKKKENQASACRTKKGLVKVDIPGRLNANNQRSQNMMAIGPNLSESIDLKKRRARVRVKNTLLHLHEIQELRYTHVT